MANLGLLCVLLSILLISSQTPCVAYRPLRPRPAVKPSDNDNEQPIVVLSITRKIFEASVGVASTDTSGFHEKTESEESGSHDHHGTKETAFASDVGEVDSELNPCMEPETEGSSESERGCHRLLGDYSAPEANKNPKHG